VEKTSKWRWGVNRWLVLLFIILGFIASRIWPPVLPTIKLPAEVIFHIGNFGWTNSMTAMVIADVLLVIIALVVRRAANNKDMVPKGFSGAVEALLEVIHNLTETTAGRWTRAIFPFFATITLLVLLVNWTELIPGVDSIGLIEKAPVGEQGYAVAQSFIGPTLTPEKGEYILVPFVRTLSTDLNFTVALALISIFMTQVIGVRALGPKYFGKFWNVSGFFSRPIFGVIDWGVGLLELVSEFSKILSFSFRLFGNIFAGSVLLFVVGTLVPVLFQTFILLLEFFVGAIQAIIFGMLTMVFMSQATQGHGNHEEGHASS
jgi:F-type H+-transporting ATPase subunit a